MLGIDDVPDPYYGGAHGLERVLDIIEAGGRGLLAHIRTQYAGSLTPPSARKPQP